MTVPIDVIIPVMGIIGLCFIGIALREHFLHWKDARRRELLDLSSKIWDHTATLAECYRARELAQMLDIASPFVEEEIGRLADENKH